MNGVDATYLGLNNVVDVVHHEGVGADSAHQRRYTSTCDQGIVAAVRGDDVRKRVARQSDGGSSGTSQVLHVGRSGVADRGQYGIVAMHRTYLHHVVDVVDYKSVVAGAADHRCHARSRNQRVVVAVGGDDVVQVIASQGDRSRSSAGQILHVGGCGVAHGGLDGVCTAHFGLYDIGGVVDHEGVVARAADHRCHTGSGNKRVIARVGGDHVAQVVACERDCISSRSNQILHVSRCGVAD